MSLVAVLATVAAVLLVRWRPSASPVVRDVGGRSSGGPRGLARAVSVGLAATGVVAVAAGGWHTRGAVLVGIGSLTGWVAVRLLRARARRRDAEATSAQVLEVCESVAADLGAGQPPGAVLERGAVEWPMLAGVAESFRVGADVPEAWREASRRPGASGLRLVGAAWQVSHRTGAGLALTLDQVVTDLRAARATRRVVDGELASARSTAKLIAGLPVLALVMGSGAGGDPWGFLLGTPLGLGCLALGLGFGSAGLLWIEALARGVDRR